MSELNNNNPIPQFSEEFKIEEAKDKDKKITELEKIVEEKNSIESDNLEPQSGMKSPNESSEYVRLIEKFLSSSLYIKSYLSEVVELKGANLFSQPEKTVWKYRFFPNSEDAFDFINCKKKVKCQSEVEVIITLIQLSNGNTALMLLQENGNVYILSYKAIHEKSSGYYPQNSIYEKEIISLIKSKTKIYLNYSSCEQNTDPRLFNQKSSLIFFIGCLESAYKENKPFNSLNKFNDDIGRPRSREELSRLYDHYLEGINLEK